MTSPPMEDSKTAIIGGGIGGLVTALQLHSCGFRNIHVFETASNLAPAGVGINIQPFAVLVLKKLGLLPALLETGIETEEFCYYNQFGDKISSEPRGKAAEYLIPQISIHRGHLQMLLFAAVKERIGVKQIHLDHALLSIEQPLKNSEAVKLQFENRGQANGYRTVEVAADLVIGVDGINSTVRRILYPDEGSPKWSGRMLWRGCVEDDPYLTGATIIQAGYAAQKFIAYPISKAAQSRKRSLVNWIAEMRVREVNDANTIPPGQSDWSKPVPKERFIDDFRDWSLGFLDIMTLVDKTDQILEYPMCDRDPLPQWSFGRLTLLGDAAHPMYPIGSNGASQAILDAESLVRHLRKCTSRSEIDAALVAYQDERLPATAKIVLANRGEGPDRVMQLAHQRAPNGFKNIDSVISKQELAEIRSYYRTLTGADIDKVNADFLRVTSEG